MTSVSNITKSTNDTRDYRALLLPNGLRALLISDLKTLIEGPETMDDEDTDAESLPNDSGEEDEGSMEEMSDQSDEENADNIADEGSGRGEGKKKEKEKSEKLSAAALCIGTGSFSDPETIPGLAHFLEHMVFMGSEKYPDENHFDSYLREHGGSSNAYTDCERTVFYFDIRKKHFRQALDIFAQFFINPLMKKDSVDREIKAVDSEFDMSKTADKYRKEQLLGSMAKEKHPMGKFMWGSLESLKTIPSGNGIDIYEHLQTFHKKSYSSHYMTLAVQSRDDLDTLEEWVKEIFSAVPNNSQPCDSFRHMSEPFDTENFYKLYKVVPVKNRNQVEVTWSLPCMQQHYRVKPLHYLGWLIGHEGKGSILSYLKKKYWATSLDSGNGENGFEHNSTYAVFSVNVTLTEAGLDNVEEVLNVIFEYVAMLRKVGAQKQIFAEIQQIEANGFRWQEQCDPVDYVDSVCVNMQLYPESDYLTGDELLFEYDSQLIEQCQNCLVPSKANVIISSKRFGSKDLLKERWFQTPYSVEDIPKAWISQWESLEPRQNIFHIPAPNEYIATDFNIKEPEVFATAYPVQIRDNEHGRLWYKKDSKFKVPKAYYHFKCVSSIINQSPHNQCLMDLFLRVLDHSLNEIAYAADVAQLSYSVKGTEKALVIKVSGFNHKLSKLFETIVDHIASFNLSEELFSAVKEQLKKSYYNECIKPSTLATDLRLQVLQENYWTVVEKRNVLDSMTKEKLLHFIKTLTEEMYVEGLVQGNITVQEAKNQLQVLLEKLKCRPLSKSIYPNLRITRIPVGQWYCRAENFNAEDNNSVIINYYQHGTATLREYCLNDLLTFKMEEPCFDVLRTREQLGYSVYNTNRNTAGILAFSVTVCSQADKFNMQQLDDRIEAFLIEFEGMLNNLTQEEFDRVRSSLIGLKQCEDSNLGEEVSRNWNEINCETFMFDRLAKEVKILEKLSKEEFLGWYKSLTLGSGKCKKLSIQVVGHNRSADKQSAAMSNETHQNDTTETSAQTRVMFLPVETMDSSKVIVDPVTFRQNQSLYPVSRILG